MSIIEIEDSETDAKIREMAQIKGQPVELALREVVDAELLRLRKADKDGFRRKMREIAYRYSLYPVTDPRDPDDMLYDEHGLPK